MWIKKEKLRELLWEESQKTKSECKNNLAWHLDLPYSMACWNTMLEHVKALNTTVKRFDAVMPKKDFKIELDPNLTTHYQLREAVYTALDAAITAGVKLQGSGVSQNDIWRPIANELVRYIEEDYARMRGAIY